VRGAAAGCARGAGAAASERDWLARRGPYRSRLDVWSVRGGAGCVRELATTLAEEEMVRLLDTADQDVEYSRRKARTLVSRVRYSGCRVLPTESENPRFPGCGIQDVEYSRRKARTLVSLDAVFGMSSTLDGKREPSFPRMRYSGCRVLSTESENTRFPGGPGCRVLSTAFENTQSLALAIADGSLGQGR